MIPSLTRRVSRVCASRPKMNRPRPFQSPPRLGMVERETGSLPRVAGVQAARSADPG
jgi:hypothetical protein